MAPLSDGHSLTVIVVRRIEHPNHARFLTFSCYQRLPLFDNNAIKDAFVTQLSQTRDRTGFKLFAWVVMPEHVHLVLTPNLPEYSVSRVLWWLKRDFAKRIIARWRELDEPVLTKITDPQGSPRFWQRGGGYDRNLVAGPELDEKIAYVHANPVRRGLVERDTDWEWSSARWWAGRRDGELPCDPIR